MHPGLQRRVQQLLYNIMNDLQAPATKYAVCRKYLIAAAKCMMDDLTNHLKFSPCFGKSPATEVLQEFNVCSLQRMARGWLARKRVSLLKDEQADAGCGTIICYCNIH